MIGRITIRFSNAQALRKKLVFSQDLESHLQTPVENK